MTIKGIEIKNVKSIKSTYLDLKKINCLIGENGAGKSNILKAIKYFYDNLDKESYSKDLFDKSNPYNYSFEITIYYDFSRLIMIKEVNEFKSIEKGSKLNPTFKLISSIERYLDSNKILAVTMTQDKNDLPKWNTTPFNIRVFLKNQFPIYFVQTRSIDLYDWSYIWEAIGELSKVKESNKSLKAEVEQFFKEFYSSNYSRFAKSIEQVMNNSNIDIKRFKPNELFSHIYKLQLGGEKFRYQDTKLEFFSDGLNSYSYLTLLISLVKQLSSSTLKEPTIILDEPEIGLHPQKIDEVTNVINGKTNKNKKSASNLNYIIATHSSRLIRNVVNSPLSRNIYHLKMNNNYTRINKLNDFIENDEKLLLSEKEASFYFSKGILFVEGQTELELFQHPLLKEIYPVLNEIDVFSFDSNNVKLKTILPSEKNTGIPYLVLYDLDKIISVNKYNRISIKGDSINPLKNKKVESEEIFLFGRKRIKTYELRKRILGYKKRKDFVLNPDPKWLHITDTKYREFKHLVKTYCLEYNVFVVDNTIEGSIVNGNSLELVLDWLTIDSQLSIDNLTSLVTLLHRNRQRQKDLNCNIKCNTLCETTI
ncbi:retron Eco8 family effector endonuclease [Oceanobacillus caeni]|uniref:retron Eco8 family effector endonuclease n=1 Tax=Oceanobacillus caeni TaxID=405946 RepID=UPI002E21F58B|nr:retron Eco8 family effector endonuclease [Oceanobacillus caeni]